MPPRTAAALWSCCEVLADQAYDDVKEFGDDPVTRDDGNWIVFDRYPQITWRQDAVWRRQAARAFDDLAAELAAGEWPSPRCAAEEMALHLALRTAKSAYEDDWASVTHVIKDLPAHAEDFDWSLLGDVLFQDHDILSLFDRSLDGIEDPDSELNQAMMVGDYRPGSWFSAFAGAEPRDPRRPFRR